MDEQISHKPTSGFTIDPPDQERVTIRMLDGSLLQGRVVARRPTGEGEVLTVELTRCTEWKGLDMEIEDTSACVVCGRLYEEHDGNS